MKLEKIFPHPSEPRRPALVFSRFGYHGFVTDKQWIEFLKESIASHDRRIGELTDRIAAQTANIDKLVTMSDQRRAHPSLS